MHQLGAEFERLIEAGLQHPSIAAPIATGIYGVSAFLATEFVTAESLDLAVRQYGPAPPADAVRVASQLAAALDTAHAKGVTHGALHPRDVLLAGDETRLSGLGVVRALEAVGVAPPIRRPYTAPERMVDEVWDRRAADQFGLAALVFELLWGRRVTGAGAQAVADVADLAAADMPALRAAFARALDEKPLQRFQSAAAFAEAFASAFSSDTKELKVHVMAPSPKRPEPVRELAAIAEEEAPRLPLDGPEPVAVIADVLASAAPAIAGPAPESDPLLDPVLDPTPLKPVPPKPAAPPAADDEEKMEAAADEPEAEAEPDPEPEAVPVTAPVRSIRLVRGVDAVDAPPDIDDLALRGAAAATDDPADDSTLSSVASNRIWPIAASLLIGVALGFAGGYGFGLRERAMLSTASEAVATPDAPAPAATTGRDFTESVVPVGPKATDASKDGGATEVPMPVPSPSAVAAASTPASAGAPVPAPKPEAATAANKPPPAPGRLFVRSTPSGAKVFVDGREYGQTPVAVHDLSRGAHRVRIAQDGYTAEERRITITPRNLSQALNVPLAKPKPAAPAVANAGVLTFESKPAGAKVFVDGRLVGKTPLQLPEVAAGAHAVRLEHDGYRRWSSSVRVAANETYRVTASLER